MAVSLYALNWYEFESNATKKSLIILMIKFQKKIKINIFRVIELNLQLFVSVSKT